MSFRTALLALFLSFSASAIAQTQAQPQAQPAEQPYLYDLLDKPAYAKSWKALFKDEKKVDAWLAAYAKTQDGPATPGKLLKLDGKDYRVNMVCKRHDCDINQFFVLFTQDGSAAWGLQVKGKGNERFFGKPDDQKKQALRSAVTSP
jgi:Inhibitor of vertebrate lysozyme (Ivy)